MNNTDITSAKYITTTYLRLLKPYTKKRQAPRHLRSGAFQTLLSLSERTEDQTIKQEIRSICTLVVNGNIAAAHKALTAVAELV